MLAKDRKVFQIWLMQPDNNNNNNNNNNKCSADVSCAAAATAPLHTLRTQIINILSALSATSTQHIIVALFQTQNSTVWNLARVTNHLTEPFRSILSLPRWHLDSAFSCILVASFRILGY